MNFACQHLLRRRDLSCTKVNAVNRLSDCLDASFRLSRDEAAPTPPPAPPGARPRPVRWVGGSKRIDAALQTGRCFERVSPVG